MADDDQRQPANWDAPVPPPPQPKWKWQTQGLAPGEQPRTNWGVSRRTGTVILIVLILGAVAVVIAGGLSDRPVERSEPTVRELIRARCPSHPACGIELDDRGAVLGFTLLPDATSDGGAALAIWARETGCIESIDISRMEQTRAIDGMVESANGRSTWTYHPDDGLTIVCEP